MSDKIKLFSEYSWHKSDTSIIKKIVLAIIGGFFIGLGCAAFLRIACADLILPGVGLFLGSFVFATGFVMCMIFGGNIYTSNAAEFQSVLEKKLKWKHFFMDLGIVTIGNWIGGILIALICWGMGMFGDINSILWHSVFEFAKHKIELDGTPNAIWKNILSSTVTNILIITSLIMFVTFDKKVIGFTAMLMAIIIFVIGGYQHVVADFFFTTLALLMGNGESNIGELAWQTFGYCLIPTAIGNLLGGMLVVYLFNVIHKTIKTPADPVVKQPKLTKQTKQTKPVA